MQAPKFELNKIRRLINTAGVNYTFERAKLDEFKEPAGYAPIAVIKGVFHQTTQHVSIIASDASSVQSKQTPYILTLYEDAKDLQQGDMVQINGMEYTVTGMLNINNWDIAIDISLEHTV